MSLTTSKPALGMMWMDDSTRVAISLGEFVLLAACLAVMALGVVTFLRPALYRVWSADMSPNHGRVFSVLAFVISAVALIAVLRD